MSGTFKVLTVCTGNVCRSPLAQQLLQKGLDGVSSISVSSAGIQAMVDHPMPDQSLGIAQQNGVNDAEMHRGQQINETLIDSADLIFAMDRSHRRSIVELNPRANRRVFTIREFARLISATNDVDLQAEVREAGESTVAKLQAAVEAARLSRSDLLPLEKPDDDDVIDPYGQNEKVFQDSAQQLIPAIRSVVSYFKRSLEVK